ncbi:hypothetical protein BDC45DRAFT_573336 [Circinella umbellata]|nr:hypothetical protein BDC45DRAFT_573336 [Circinella umbellata]
MSLNEEFSFMYQNTSTGDILCGPLQQLEESTVLMLLQPHEQQQHTMNSNVHNFQCDNNSNNIGSISSSFLPPTLSTNDNINKKTKPSPITTTTTTTTITNSEISPETACWDSPTLETVPNTISSSPNTSSTQRRRSRTSFLSNPARRAEHNATERARRESLNGKFKLLASILPNLHTAKKPSKSQIIEKALEWVEHSLLNEERCLFELHRLEQENIRIGNQLQQCLISSQQQQQWPLNNTPPNHHHDGSSGIHNNHCYTTVPSPPSSTKTSVSSLNYTIPCKSENNSNNNVTPIMITPSTTTTTVDDVSRISQHQQYHHYQQQQHHSAC